MDGLIPIITLCNLFLYRKHWYVNVLTTLSVCSSIITQTHRPSSVPPLVRALGPSSWTMWDVLVPRVDLWTVPIMELAHITVPTLKMLVSAAVPQVCVAKYDGGRAV